MTSGARQASTNTEVILELFTVQKIVNRKYTLIGRQYGNGLQFADWTKVALSN